MSVIDDRGRILGAINIIDALVVLVVVGAAVAGLAHFAGESGEGTPSRTVVVDVGEQPKYVVDAIEEGSIETDEVIAVRDKSVVTANGESHLRLTVTIAVTENADGLPMFKNERLYIGRRLTLDLGKTIVTGTVVDMN